MNFDVDFKKQDCCFATDFGETQSADAGGYDKGYEIGYSTGHQKGYTEGETAGYENGYTDGQKSVPNLFEYAVELNSTFKSAIFPDNYELTLVLPSVTSIQSSFQGATGIKKLTLKGNIEKKIITCTYAFRSESIEVIDFSEFSAIVGNGTYAFNGAIALKEIKGELDFSQCSNTNQMFYKCSELAEVRLKANTLSLSISFAQSSKLSVVSIQSIFDGLAIVTTAQTLTLPKTLSAEAEAVVSANTEEIGGEIRIKGKEGWTLVR